MVALEEGVCLPGVPKLLAGQFAVDSGFYREYAPSDGAIASLLTNLRYGPSHARSLPVRRP